MAKHLGAYSSLHGPAGKALTDYVEANIPPLWNRVPERITSVANTGSIYTGVLPGYTTEDPFVLTPDKTLFFTPHIICNNAPALSLNTLAAYPILFQGETLGAGDLQPNNTYTLLTKAVAGGTAYEFHLLPGLAAPPHTLTHNFTDLGAREGTASSTLSRNNIALRQALSSGLVYYTEPGAFFHFSAGSDGTLDTHADNSGLVGRGSSPTVFEMSTGSGQFDCDNSTIPFNSRNKVLIYSVGAEGQTFSNLHIRLQDSPSGTDRACYPLFFGDTLNLTLGDLEFSNFTFGEGGLLRLNSLRGITRAGTIVARDCNPSFPTNPSYPQAFIHGHQLSTVEIDNYRTNGLYSTGQFIFSSIEGYNLLPTKDIRDGWEFPGGTIQYGAQTDVFNSQALNTLTIVGDRVIGISVGEVVDIWSHYFSIKQIYARNIYDTGALKLVYGASFGSVGLIDCDTTALYVVYIQPADPEHASRPSNCTHIHIGSIRASNVASLWDEEWEPRGHGRPTGIAIVTSALSQSGATNIPDFIHMPDINLQGSVNLGMAAGIFASGGENVYASGKISRWNPTGRKVDNSGDFQINYQDTDLGREEVVLRNEEGDIYTPVLAFTTGDPTGMAYTATWRGTRALGWVHGNIQIIITSIGTGGSGNMYITLPSTGTLAASFPAAVDFVRIDLPAGTTGISALAQPVSAMTGTYYAISPRLLGDNLPSTYITPAMCCPGGASTALTFNIRYLEA